MTYIIYTDGSCSGNRRDAGCKGGYGYIILDASESSIICGKGIEDNTTNNQMEMMAVIESLKALIKYLEESCDNSKNHNCIIKTDSKYVCDNFIEYVPLWKSMGWRKTNGSKVLNIRLWKQIDSLTREFKSFCFQWVKGHASNRWNEKADALAQSYIERKRLH